MPADYLPLFSPQSLPRASSRTGTMGDRAPESVYVFSEDITLVVNVALATGRPLLVRGASGTGKTSLARSLAAQLGAGYREAVVTARTQARDLLWTTDLLRRLQDAQIGRLSPDWRSYITPGPLWWAFDPASAREQQQDNIASSPSDAALEPGQRVLLVDEIELDVVRACQELNITSSSPAFRQLAAIALGTGTRT